MQQANSDNFPKFKETLQTEEQLNSMLRDLLPQLKDDDYFIDKKDSLVYSYLMKNNVIFFVFAYRILQTTKEYLLTVFLRNFSQKKQLPLVF